MQSEQVNIYEQVFESWLKEQKVSFDSVVQTQRVQLQQQSIKNFDFLIRPGSDSPILIEVKGRTFHGTSLAGLKGLDSWVTFEDVDALSYWQKVYKEQWPQAQAMFVFLYRIEQIDVETDGLPLYDFDGDRFLILSVLLDDYRKAMKRRSPKWQTVMLSAADFRKYAMVIETTDFL